MSYKIGDDVIMVEGFEHLPGYNCQLSSLRKVIRFRGIRLSEEMLMGLAEGVGFIYWGMKQMPFPFVGGLNGRDIFGTATRRLGGDVEYIKTTSPRRSYAKLKEMLQEGPVIPMVDIAFLPYFFREDADYPNEDAGHFGAHTFVVYGLNEPENKVYVSDRYSRPNELRINEFMDAHSSRFKPFPAVNQKLKFTYPEGQSELESLIIDAVRANREVMMNPPISNLGLKGMLKFKKLVAKWPETYQGEDLLMGLVTTWIYNQTGGTGGSNCRNLYVRFLKEAHEVTGRAVFEEAAKVYERAARHWDEVAYWLLPDEVPAMTEIRKAFWETNKIQEDAAPDYRKRLGEVDNRWKGYKEAAIEDARDWGKYVPHIQEAIQKAHDAEAEAWKVLSQL